MCQYVLLFCTILLIQRNGIVIQLAKLGKVLGFAREWCCFPNIKKLYKDYLPLSRLCLRGAFLGRDKDILKIVSQILGINPFRF